MRKLWIKLSNIFSRLTSPQTEADAKINKCDYALVALSLFIVAYGIFLYNRPHTSPVKETTHVNFVTNKVEVFVAPKNLKDFVEGEFVGVRYFGVYGVVLGKKFQIGGAVYEIIYKDNDGVLQKIDVEKWLLFIPDKNELIADTLRNH
jgi:hypothetical protein